MWLREKVLDLYTAVASDETRGHANLPNSLQKKKRRRLPVCCYSMSCLKGGRGATWCSLEGDTKKRVLVVSGYTAWGNRASKWSKYLDQFVCSKLAGVHRNNILQRQRHWLIPENESSISTSNPHTSSKIRRSHYLLKQTLVPRIPLPFRRLYSARRTV